MVTKKVIALLLDNRKNSNLYKNYLWKKKIPVPYGNIIFQEHPEGPAVVNKAVCYHYVPFSKPRLEVIRLCPNSSI